MWVCICFCAFASDVFLETGLERRALLTRQEKEEEQGFLPTWNANLFFWNWRTAEVGHYKSWVFGLSFVCAKGQWTDSTLKQETVSKCCVLHVR